MQVQARILIKSGSEIWKLYLRQERYLSVLYCKSCKGHVRVFNYWYLFDNAQFTNRIAIIGKCFKCNQDIILLSEQRKSDYKIFNDLYSGNKARDLIAKCSECINYTQSDIKDDKTTVPFGWKYGKSVKLKNGYRILRSDFKGNIEIIGYIPINGKNIISEEEYEKLNERINN